MKIERIITIFEKEKGGQYIKDIKAAYIDVSVLKKLYKPYSDDPNFYRPYQIEQSQYSILTKYVKELEDYSPTNYDLYIEAVQIS